MRIIDKDERTFFDLCKCILYMYMNFDKNKQQQQQTHSSAFNFTPLESTRSNQISQLLCRSVAHSCRNNAQTLGFHRSYTHMRTHTFFLNLNSFAHAQVKSQLQQQQQLQKTTKKLLNYIRAYLYEKVNIYMKTCVQANRCNES